VTRDELSAIAERALAHTRGAAQVTVNHERSLLSRYARSRPTQATAIDELSVEITAWKDGVIATAETNSAGDDSLRDLAHRAAAAAEAGARSGPGDHPGLPEPGEPARDHDGFDPETARLDPAPSGAALQTAFDVAAARGFEAHGTWSAGAVLTAVASTTGLRASDATTDAFCKVVQIAPGGRSGYAARGAVSARDIDAAPIATEAADRVGDGEPAALEPGEYDVVLAPDAVAVILEFLGWLAFSGQAYVDGASALVGRLGTRVAAARINLSDAPRYRTTLPRAIDAEGVAKRPIPLIQDGVANAVVHDTRSAARAGGGATSTGHALPGGAPPAPTNLVLVGGGAADEAELAAPIERGLLVTRLWYVNPVHARSTLLTGVTRDGTFLIEDGVVTRPLRDVRFTDSVLRILDGTEALTAATRLVCEGEFYGRRWATGTVCPALRARGFRVTGSAA
jgi:predicted Zn-dependent protease